MPAFNAIRPVEIEIFQGAEISLTLRGQNSDWTGCEFDLQLRAGLNPVSGSIEDPVLSIPAGGAAPGGSTFSVDQATGPALASLVISADDSALIPHGANYSGEIRIHRPGHGPKPLVRILATVKKGNTRG